MKISEKTNMTLFRTSHGKDKEEIAEKDSSDTEFANQQFESLKNILHFIIKVTYKLWKRKHQQPAQTEEINNNLNNNKTLSYEKKSHHLHPSKYRRAS